VEILETSRLTVRHLTTDDAAFIVDLLNQPSFLENIGDKGVRTVEDARQFLLDGPMASYAQNGFGLYLVELGDSEIPIGICGLLKREGLEDVDIGFALLPQFWSKGYAIEAASAVMDHGRESLGLDRIVAIVSPGNERSCKLLEKLGLRFERLIRLAEDQAEIELFTPSATRDEERL